MPAIPSGPVPFTARDPMLQFFDCAELSAPLRAVMQPFKDLAVVIADGIPRNPERTVCLRKLLEAMDCAVRASHCQPF